VTDRARLQQRAHDRDAERAGAAGDHDVTILEQHVLFSASPGAHHTIWPDRKKPRGMLCSVSNPVLVTRTISPVCTPAVLSRVMTLGCTTMHMFSCSTIFGVLAAGRLFEPMIGWK
jgi:hypothetical protein